jgi:DNA-binding response OmpR family regulator
MRLLVVDDEADLAHALAKGLRQQGYAVDLAFDGMQGLELAMVNDYDLAILDLNLPEMDGLEVCRRLRAARFPLLILILTARDQPDERITGLDLGADDYLVKPFHFGELTARVRALLRRDMRVRSPLLQYEDLKLDPTTRVMWQGNRRIELTAKEFGILEYLLRHQGAIISQETLLEHVWDIHANPLTNTVRVHINSLRRKLEDMAETPRYIETIVGQGYRLGAPGSPGTPEAVEILS